MVNPYLMIECYAGVPDEGAQGSADEFKELTEGRDQFQGTDDDHSEGHVESRDEGEILIVQILYMILLKMLFQGRCDFLLLFQQMFQRKVRGLLMSSRN